MLKDTHSDNKKNIMLVIPNLYGSGAERVTATICKNLNKDLFNVCACHLKERSDTGEELESAGYDVIGLPPSRFFRNNYFSFLDIRDIVKRKKIDLIHSHLTEGLIETSLHKLLYPETRLIHTFHYGNYLNADRKTLIAESLLWRLPDKLIAVGNEQREQIKKALKIPDARIETVWNGVEIQPNCIDQDIMNRFRKSGKTILASLSTLIEQKGLMFLLDVIHILRKKHDNFVFLIAGDGPLRTELEAKSRTLGLADTVFYLGWVKNAASKILPAIDIFVQSSLWEAMSVVLIEAMAAGRPITTTDVGENRHVIDHGENGFVVEPGNINMMSEALERLILHKDLRAEFGVKAQQKYEQYFTSKIMAQKYENAYLELL